MLNSCWSNTKRFLSVLVVFGKSLVFGKMSKISKTALPCFGDSIVGWSSRMSQSRAHTEIFLGSLAGQCPNREKYLEYFSKFGILMFLVTQFGNLFAGGRSSREGTQRFSRLTSRVELPVAKNTYIKIFKIFVLIVLTTGLGDFLATWLSCKNRVFCANRSIFKLFLFSLELLWLFIVILILSLSKTHRALNPNLHCWSSLQHHSPRKRFGFLFSHSILHVYECISSFCEILLSLCVLLWFEHRFD